MQFQEDARVIHEADEIGRLARIIIDPRTMQISDLVVLRAGLSAEEKMVPISLVDTTINGEIVLKSFRGGWQQLQDYLEVDYHAIDEQDLLRADNLGGYSAPILFAYPPVIPATGAIYPPPGIIRNDTSILSIGIDRGFQKVERENIPEENIVIEPGTDVFSIDQEKLGSVEQVFTSEESRQVTHLVIVKGAIFKERKLIPVNWVNQVEEHRVQLGVSARFIGRLPEFEGR